VASIGGVRNPPPKAAGQLIAERSAGLTHRRFEQLRPERPHDPEERAVSHTPDTHPEQDHAGILVLTGQNSGNANAIVNGALAMNPARPQPPFDSAQSLNSEKIPEPRQF
jgi:hypothetical protein